MKLSRVCSKFNKGKWNISLFGYDEDRTPVKKTVVYEDYFFYDKEFINDVATYGFRVEEGKTYPSLYGKDVVKVYYRSIKNKNQLVRSKPDRIFEADILPEQKYILDNKLEWSSYRNIMFFDIETWYDEDDPDGNMPDAARLPITAIVGYSTLDKEYFVFSWKLP